MCVAFSNCTKVKSSSTSLHTEALQSDHHEADTRLVVSIQNSKETNVIVETKDTDVFFVLILNYTQFSHKNVYEAPL